MAITLPSSAQANSDTSTANEAAIVAAQNAFVANATVLINNAVNNDLFMVQPYLPNLVSSDFVTGYFAPLGYSVLFPIIPTYPYNPSFVPGFPEVLPPGYVQPFYNYGANSTQPRIQISWAASPVPALDFFSLESGGSDIFLLEDGIDGLLLEA